MVNIIVNLCTKQGNLDLKSARYNQEWVKWYLSNCLTTARQLLDICVTLQQFIIDRNQVFGLDLKLIPKFKIKPLANPRFGCRPWGFSFGRFNYNEA